MTNAKHSAFPIRFGVRPRHGPDVRVERFGHSKRLSSPLSSQLSPRHPKGDPMVHPNGWPPRSCACSRVGIQAVQRLRGAHLDTGCGRHVGRFRGRARRIPGLARGVGGRLAVAFRHQRLDLCPRLPDLLPASGAHLPRGSVSSSFSQTFAGTDRHLPGATFDLLLSQWIAP